MAYRPFKDFWLKSAAVALAVMLPLLVQPVVPTMLSVLAFALIVLALIHTPFKSSVAPLIAVIVPLGLFTRVRFSVSPL